LADAVSRRRCFLVIPAKAGNACVLGEGEIDLNALKQAG
jgi:hypothetical protein